MKHSKFLSEFFKGENNPMYGKKGEENPFYGKHHTERAKKVMSEKHKGLKASPETLKKMSEARMGEKNPNYHKPMSEEQKQKISETRMGKYKGMDHPFAKSVKCIETGEIFESIKQAVEWCGGGAHIYDCLQGKRKSAGRHPETHERLHWKLVEN